MPALESLASALIEQENFEPAEAAFHRVISIQERAFGPSHAEVAPHLDKLAMLLYNQKRYADSEKLYRRSLEIWAAVPGADLASSLDNLAVACAAQEKYSEAASLFQTSLAIRENGAVKSLSNLALALEGQGKYAAAERQYRLAIVIAEKIPGPSPEDTALRAKIVKNHDALVRKMKGPKADAKTKK